MADFRFEHAGIAVRDLPAAVAWYRTAFGLRPVFEFTVDGPGLSGVILESPHGYRIELLSRPGSAPGPRSGHPAEAALTEGYGHVALRVPELDPAYRELVARGAGEVLAPGASPESGVRMAWLADPEGNLIELVEKPLAATD
jgi:catechol 2,3-dioxygenase-like lactoylglutathione lyase family enzyme